MTARSRSLLGTLPALASNSPFSGPGERRSLADVPSRALPRLFEGGSDKEGESEKLARKKVVEVGRDLRCFFLSGGVL